MASSNYIEDQIARTNASRSNYERGSTKENLRKLDEEYGRLQRAMENKRASGAGRGTSKASDYKRNTRRG
jgi:hypothetical protein